MGVRVSEKREVEPGWLDLPRGVSVLVRPLTPSLYQTARIAGTRKVTELQKSQAKILAAGGTVGDLPDLSDENARLGMSQVFFAEHLAIEAILEWREVFDMEGAPAVVTDGLVRGLMADPLINDSFLHRYVSKFEARLAEGKDSGTSPNGITAKVPDTAKDAET